MSYAERLNKSGLPMFHLRRIGPPATRRGVADVMDFYDVTTMIGKSPQSNYLIGSASRIQHSYISRNHARVVVRAPSNDHNLFDDSMNGMFINNIKILNSAILSEGDRVTFGHPQGQRIAGGYRVVQPDSEYQFLFEKCSCSGPVFTNFLIKAGQRPASDGTTFAVPEVPVQTTRYDTTRRDRNTTQTLTSEDVLKLKKEYEENNCRNPTLATSSPSSCSGSSQVRSNLENDSNLSSLTSLSTSGHGAGIQTVSDTADSQGRDESSVVVTGVSRGTRSTNEAKDLSADDSTTVRADLETGASDNVIDPTPDDLSMARAGVSDREPTATDNVVDNATNNSREDMSNTETRSADHVMESTEGNSSMVVAAGANNGTGADDIEFSSVVRADVSDVPTNTAGNVMDTTDDSSIVMEDVSDTANMAAGNEIEPSTDDPSVVGEDVLDTATVASGKAMDASRDDSYMVRADVLDTDTVASGKAMDASREDSYMVRADVLDTDTVASGNEIEPSADNSFIVTEDVSDTATMATGNAMDASKDDSSVIREDGLDTAITAAGNVMAASADDSSMVRADERDTVAMTTGNVLEPSTDDSAVVRAEATDFMDPSTEEQLKLSCESSTIPSGDDEESFSQDGSAGVVDLPDRRSPSSGEPSSVSTELDQLDRFGMVVKLPNDDRGGSSTNTALHSSLSKTSTPKPKHTESSRRADDSNMGQSELYFRLPKDHIPMEEDGLERQDKSPTKMCSTEIASQTVSSNKCTPTKDVSMQTSPLICLVEERLPLDTCTELVEDPFVPGIVPHHIEDIDMESDFQDEGFTPIEDQGAGNVPEKMDSDEFTPSNVPEATNRIPMQCLAMDIKEEKTSFKVPEISDLEPRVEGDSMSCMSESTDSAECRTEFVMSDSVDSASVFEESDQDDGEMLTIDSVVVDEPFTDDSSKCLSAEGDTTQNITDASDVSPLDKTENVSTDDIEDGDPDTDRTVLNVSGEEDSSITSSMDKTKHMSSEDLRLDVSGEDISPASSLDKTKHVSSEDLVLDVSGEDISAASSMDKTKHVSCEDFGLDMSGEEDISVASSSLEKTKHVSCEDFGLDVSGEDISAASSMDKTKHVSCEDLGLDVSGEEDIVAASSLDKTKHVSSEDLGVLSDSADDVDKTVVQVIDTSEGTLASSVESAQMEKVEPTSAVKTASLNPDIMNAANCGDDSKPETDFKLPTTSADVDGPHQDGKEMVEGHMTYTGKQLQAKDGHVDESGTCDLGPDETQHSMGRDSASNKADDLAKAAEDTPITEYAEVSSDMQQNESHDIAILDRATDIYTSIKLTESDEEMNKDSNYETKGVCDCKIEEGGEESVLDIDDNFPRTRVMEADGNALSDNHAVSSVNGHVKEDHNGTSSLSAHEQNMFNAEEYVSIEVHPGSRDSNISPVKTSSEFVEDEIVSQEGREQLHGQSVSVEDSERYRGHSIPQSDTEAVEYGQEQKLTRGDCYDGGDNRKTIQADATETAESETGEGTDDKSCVEISLDFSHSSASGEDVCLQEDSTRQTLDFSPTRMEAHTTIDPNLCTVMEPRSPNNASPISKNIRALQEFSRSISPTVIPQSQEMFVDQSQKEMLDVFMSPTSKRRKDRTDASEMISCLKVSISSLSDTSYLDESMQEMKDIPPVFIVDQQLLESNSHNLPDDVGKHSPSIEIKVMESASSRKPATKEIHVQESASVTKEVDVSLKSISGDKSFTKEENILGEGISGTSSKEGCQDTNLEEMSEGTNAVDKTSTDIATDSVDGQKQENSSEFASLSTDSASSLSLDSDLILLWEVDNREDDNTNSIQASHSDTPVIFPGTLSPEQAGDSGSKPGEETPQILGNRMDTTEDHSQRLCELSSVNEDLEKNGVHNTSTDIKQKHSEYFYQCCVDTKQQHVAKICSWKDTTEQTLVDATLENDKQPLGDAAVKCVVATREQPSVDMTKYPSVDKAETCSVDAMAQRSEDKAETCLGDAIEQCSVVKKAATRSVGSKEQRSLDKAETVSVDEMEHRSIDANEQLSVDAIEQCSVEKAENVSVDDTEQCSLDAKEQRSGDAIEQHSVDKAETCSVDATKTRSFSPTEELQIEDNIGPTSNRQQLSRKRKRTLSDADSTYKDENKVKRRKMALYRYVKSVVSNFFSIRNKVGCTMQSVYCKKTLTKKNVAMMVKRFFLHKDRNTKIPATSSHLNQSDERELDENDNTELIEVELPDSVSEENGNVDQPGERLSLSQEIQTGLVSDQGNVVRISQSEVKEIPLSNEQHKSFRITDECSDDMKMDENQKLDNFENDQMHMEVSECGSDLMDYNTNTASSMSTGGDLSLYQGNSPRHTIDFTSRAEHQMQSEIKSEKDGEGTGIVCCHDDLEDKTEESKETEGFSSDEVSTVQTGPKPHEETEVSRCSEYDEGHGTTDEQKLEFAGNSHKSEVFNPCVIAESKDLTQESEGFDMCTTGSEDLTQPGILNDAPKGEDWERFHSLPGDRNLKTCTGDSQESEGFSVSEMEDVHIEDMEGTVNCKDTTIECLESHDLEESEKTNMEDHIVDRRQSNDSEETVLSPGGDIEENSESLLAPVSMLPTRAMKDPEPSLLESHGSNQNSDENMESSSDSESLLVPVIAPVMNSPKKVEASVLGKERALGSIPAVGVGLRHFSLSDMDSSDISIITLPSSDELDGCSGNEATDDGFEDAVNNVKMECKTEIDFDGEHIPKSEVDLSPGQGEIVSKLLSSDEDSLETEAKVPDQNEADNYTPHLDESLIQHREQNDSLLNIYNSEMTNTEYTDVSSVNYCPLPDFETESSEDVCMISPSKSVQKYISPNKSGILISESSDELPEVIFLREERNIPVKSEPSDDLVHVKREPLACEPDPSLSTAWDGEPLPGFSGSVPIPRVMSKSALSQKSTSSPLSGEEDQLLAALRTPRKRKKMLKRSPAKTKGKTPQKKQATPGKTRKKRRLKKRNRSGNTEKCSDSDIELITDDTDSECGDPKKFITSPLNTSRSERGVLEAGRTQAVQHGESFHQTGGLQEDAQEICDDLQPDLPNDPGVEKVDWSESGRESSVQDIFNSEEFQDDSSLPYNVDVCSSMEKDDTLENQESRTAESTPYNSDCGHDNNQQMDVMEERDACPPRLTITPVKDDKGLNTERITTGLHGNDCSHIGTEPSVPMTTVPDRPEDESLSDRSSAQDKVMEDQDPGDVSDEFSCQGDSPAGPCHDMDSDGAEVSGDNMDQEDNDRTVNGRELTEEEEEDVTHDDFIPELQCPILPPLSPHQDSPKSYDDVSPCNEDDDLTPELQCPIPPPLSPHQDSPKSYDDASPCDEDDDLTPELQCPILPPLSPHQDSPKSYDDASPCDEDDDFDTSRLVLPPLSPSEDCTVSDEEWIPNTCGEESDGDLHVPFLPTLSPVKEPPPSPCDEEWIPNTCGEESDGDLHAPFLPTLSPVNEPPPSQCLSPVIPNVTMKHPSARRTSVDSYLFDNDDDDFSAPALDWDAFEDSDEKKDEEMAPQSKVDVDDKQLDIGSSSDDMEYVISPHDLLGQDDDIDGIVEDNISVKSITATPRVDDFAMPSTSAGIKKRKLFEDGDVDDFMSPKRARKNRSPDKTFTMISPASKLQTAFDSDLVIATQSTLVSEMSDSQFDKASKQFLSSDKNIDGSTKKKRAMQFLANVNAKLKKYKTKQGSVHSPSTSASSSQETPGEIAVSSSVHRRILTEAEVSNDRIDGFITRCKDLICQLRTAMCGPRLNNFPRVEQWRKDLSEVEEKAVLPKTTIAVVGDTGSGKSSLMNAIIDQHNTLPTSGMRACTAVVVEVMANTISTNFEADIKFLSRKEWFDELQLLISDLTTLDGKLKKSVPDLESEAGVAFLKVKAVYGKVDTMAALLRLTAVTRMLDQTKTIRASNPKDFRRLIDRYIETADPGAGGQFWPIVKQVTIRMPNCDAVSSGAVLVDLPGVRDSNAARDRIARQYLKNCTTVWVVAATHRAINNKTAKEMLGEQFRRQLLMDGQYGSVAFICTKADDLIPSELIRNLNLHYDCESLENEIEYLVMEQDEADVRAKQQRKEIRIITKEMEELTNELVDLRTTIQETRAVLEGDVIDLDSEGMNGQDPREELKLLLQDKEETLGAKRSEKSEKDKNRDKAQRESLEIEKKINIRRKEISALCAKARNDYSKSQIKRDFKAGLREMKRKAGLTGADDEDEMEDEDQDYNSDDDDDEMGQTADNLRVFCVSSTEYQKMKNLLTNDGPPTVFSTTEETQIPVLRRYIHELTSSRRRQSVERLIRNLGQLVFDVQSYIMADGMTCKGTRIDAKSAVEEHSRKLKEKFEPILERLCHEIEEIFASSIETKMTTGVEQAVTSANDTVAKWAAKPNREDRENGGLHWKTYQCTVRRQGMYKSPTYGDIDFNEQLSSPMYRCISVCWDKVFSGLLWRTLESGKVSMMLTLDKFVDDLCEELQTLGLPRDRTNGVSHQLCHSARDKLTEMLTNLKELVTSRQRDISRVITPTVQDGLDQTYTYCGDEGGSGMFVRMKQAMAGGVDFKRLNMFDQASQSLIMDLVHLKEDVVDHVRSVCLMLCNMLQAAFEPIWEAPSNTRLLKELLFEEVTDAVLQVTTLHREADVPLPVVPARDSSTTPNNSTPPHQTSSANQESFTANPGPSGLQVDRTTPVGPQMYTTTFQGKQQFVTYERGQIQRVSLEGSKSTSVTDVLKHIKQEPGSTQPMSTVTVKKEWSASDNLQEVSGSELNWLQQTVPNLDLYTETVSPRRASSTVTRPPSQSDTSKAKATHIGKCVTPSGTHYARAGVSPSCNTLTPTNVMLPTNGATQSRHSITPPGRILYSRSGVASTSPPTFVVAPSGQGIHPTTSPSQGCIVGPGAAVGRVRTPSGPRPSTVTKKPIHQSPSGVVGQQANKGQNNPATDTSVGLSGNSVGIKISRGPTMTGCVTTSTAGSVNGLVQSTMSGPVLNGTPMRSLLPNNLAASAAVMNSGSQHLPPKTVRGSLVIQPPQPSTGSVIKVILPVNNGKQTTTSVGNSRVHGQQVPKLSSAVTNVGQCNTACSQNLSPKNQIIRSAPYSTSTQVPRSVGSSPTPGVLLSQPYGGKSLTNKSTRTVVELAPSSSYVQERSDSRRGRLSLKRNSTVERLSQSPVIVKQETQESDAARRRRIRYSTNGGMINLCDDKH